MISPQKENQDLRKAQKAKAHASKNTVLPQKDSSWSLLCREEGTWFLAGYRTFSSGCLRPRAFSPLQTHGPWISHVTQGAYLEDQLTWDWGPEGEETEKQICPPHTEHGGEQGVCETLGVPGRS